MAEAEVDLHRVDHDERSPLLRSSSQNTSTTSISFLGILIPSLGLEKEYYWVIFPFLLGYLHDMTARCRMFYCLLTSEMKHTGRFRRWCYFQNSLRSDWYVESV